jgi:hypothetical protein
MSPDISVCHQYISVTTGMYAYDVKKPHIGDIHWYQKTYVYTVTDILVAYMYTNIRRHMYTELLTNRHIGDID